MAKALLSAFLQDLSENLATPQTKHILKRFKYLDWLKGVLLNLNALVDDAEEKQFTEGDAVKRWVNELQRNYYHLEELLGEITTKSSGPELHLKHDVLRFISSKRPYGETDEMKDSLRRIIENLEHLAKEKDALNLRELVARKGDKEYMEGLITLSADLNKDSNSRKDNFYGRKEEEKTILETLLSKGGSGTSRNITVIKIIGTAGTGKTAFARFIYSNIKVTTFFHIREWVTVPTKSNVCSLIKKTLEAITESEDFSPNNDFNLLQTKLKNYLAGKKFLLVFDNCLIKDHLDNWDKLISSLGEAGAKGSAIILTTRPVEDSVLEPPAQLDLPLDFPSTEDCWSIFQAYAFGRWKKVHRDEWLEETVGKKIINKLGNQPLAAKMVGILLQDRPHRYQWVEILTSKCLDAKLHVDLGIPLFLILCYLDLPGKLRLCLAYMSIFPKGYEFKQKDIIFLWMAQGFLHQPGKSMEEVGNEYFSFLLLRSFFQPSPSDGDSYIMQNLVHDLASYVFGESSKHHLTYEPSIEDFLKKFPDENSHLLRTILPLEREPRQLEASELDKKILQLKPQVLRVLSLSYYGITELPPSIRKLSHLCYLDLSHTALRELPESIGELYYLQTLLLKNCRSLTSLPKKLCNLKNLLYLDIRDSGVQRMPLQMNKLTSLRTLTDYVVSTRRPKIDDLAELSNLKVLSISELQNLASSNDASSAKLKKKDSLNVLILQWGSTGNNYAEKENEVLENLEPHKKIERLTIKNYFSARFPNWLGDTSYSNLRELYLCHCENCIELPPLGQVPFLQNLYIKGFNKVRYVGPEFYGSTAAPYTPFRFLEILHFQMMLALREWSISKVIEFPRLHALYIIQCPKLVQNLPKQLPSLKRLEIFECYNLVASLPKMPHSCRVFIHDSNKALTRNVQEPGNLQEIIRVSLSDFPLLPSTSDAEETTQEAVSEILSASTRSKFPADDPPSLDTSSIPRFDELSADQLSPQIKEDGPLEFTFDIPNINISKNDIQSPFVEVDNPITVQAADTPDTAPHSEAQASSSEDSDDQVSSVEMFKVTTLSQLKGLSPDLKSLKIEGFESLEALPDDLLSGIPTLQELHIVDCSTLKSFPSGGYPVSLRTLYIYNCKSFTLMKNQNIKFQFLKNLCIGSSCDSLSSFFLNLFPQLVSLCIWGCPNLLQMSISDEFQGELASLESLEIRDCPNLSSFAEGGLPTPNLASILLSNCKSLKNFPNSKNSLTSLQSLTLHKCPAFESFSLGALPSSLTLLSISFCDKLTPQKDWGLHNLESLSRFKIEGGCIGIKSFPEEKLLPSNINSLCISTLESLQKLDYKGFQNLNSLQRLELYRCQQLRFFPEEGLPSSLMFLCIKESPLLTRKLLEKTGNEWLKIAHIPNIQIDDQTLC